MKTIEQIIKERDREQFYNYYISLGYCRDLHIQY